MQFLLDVAASGTKLPFGDNVVTAVLGYGVVFAGLMILMGIIYAMGAIFKAINAREKPLKAAPAPKIRNTAREPEPLGEPARGSAGEIMVGHTIQCHWHNGLRLPARLGDAVFDGLFH